MQACKPGSVLLPNTWKKCLSFIWPVCCHADRAAYPTPMEYRSILLSEPLLTGAYLAFQLVRFTMPPVSPLGRWALTPPFHYHLIPDSRDWGYLFSVALSVNPALSREGPHFRTVRCPMLPGLSSSRLRGTR